MDEELKKITKALFEARYLKRIKRSGTSILLGPEIQESVPEHTFYVTLLGIIMHHFDPKLDFEKLITMCMIHDLEEVRTGDLNQVNRLYQKRDASLEAFTDMWRGSKLGTKLTKVHRDRTKYKSKEALAAQDCDTLAQLVVEKRISRFRQKRGGRVDELYHQAA